MRLKSLSVDRFRNLEIHDLALGSPVTQVYSANAQGKTNQSESIYLLDSLMIEVHGSLDEKRTLLRMFKLAVILLIALGWAGDAHFRVVAGRVSREA